MEKFSVLPTDERFLALYDEQKIALFEGLCNMPDLQALKEYVQREDRMKELQQRPAESFVSTGMVERMKQTYREQGCSEELVKQKLQQHLERIKQSQIMLELKEK